MVLLLSAGGITAFYPTKVPLHHRSEYLGSRDLFGDFATLMSSLTLDEKRALEEVNADYSTTTELADVLQREAGNQRTAASCVPQ